MKVRSESGGGGNSRRLAQIIVLAIALGLSAVLIAGMWRGKIQKERQSVAVAEPSESEMKLTDIEFVEIQDGRRYWTLGAAEAKYFQDQQKTMLKAVRLTFYLDGGGEIVLESQDGVLNAGTKNIELWNLVRATLPYGYELSTDRVYYEHTIKELYGDRPIQLAGPELLITGNRWRCKISERKVSVEGDVKAKVMSIPAAPDVTRTKGGKSKTARPR